jgi:hypothetical protein
MRLEALQQFLDALRGAPAEFIEIALGENLHAAFVKEPIEQTFAREGRIDELVILERRGQRLSFGPGVVLFLDVVADEDDAWTEGQALAATLEDHELVDPDLSGERLLFRLFHERGVKVFAERPIEEFCRCSTERIERLLKSFTDEERASMIGDDGRIGVTCEFCATFRSFDPADFP